MHFLPNKLALACAIALSLAACNDNSSNAPADPAATKASLMQIMDEAQRASQALTLTDLPLMRQGSPSARRSTVRCSPGWMPWTRAC